MSHRHHHHQLNILIVILIMMVAPKIEFRSEKLPLNRRWRVSLRESRDLIQLNFETIINRSPVLIIYNYRRGRIGEPSSKSWESSFSFLNATGGWITLESEQMTVFDCVVLTDEYSVYKYELHHRGLVKSSSICDYYNKTHDGIFTH